jgi:hypothetical protein
MLRNMEVRLPFQRYQRFSAGSAVQVLESLMAPLALG